jgi:hypothetical protein
LLDDYLSALLHHRTVAIWMDGDKSVAAHPVIGERLERNNAEMRHRLAGTGRPDAAGAVRASAVLGAIWRPIRNLTGVEVAPHREALIETALQGFRR